MARAIIHNYDHTVEVEGGATDDLDTVVAQARGLWQEFFGGPATEKHEQ